MREPEFDAKVPDQIVTGKGETLVRRQGQTEFQITPTVHQYTACNSALMAEDGIEVKSVKDLDQIMLDRLFGAGSPRQGWKTEALRQKLKAEQTGKKDGKTETLRQFMKRIDKKR